MHAVLKKKLGGTLCGLTNRLRCFIFVVVDVRLSSKCNNKTREKSEVDLKSLELNALYN